MVVSCLVGMERMAERLEITKPTEDWRAVGSLRLKPKDIRTR